MIVELVSLVIYQSNNLGFYVLQLRTNFTFGDMFVLSGMRATIQAIGFIVVKQSRDPLHGIQKIEYANLMSRIQKMTKEYLPNLFEEMEWKQLSDHEK